MEKRLEALAAFQDINNRNTTKPQGTFTAPARPALGSPFASTADDAAKAAKRSADERLKLEKSTLAELDRVTRAFNNRQNADLEQRLDAIRSKYADLITNLTKLGRDADVRAVEAIQAQAIAEEKARFSVEKLNEALQRRTYLLNGAEDQMRFGGMTGAEFANRIKAIEAETLPIIQQLAEQARQYSDALPGQEKADALAKIGSTMVEINEQSQGAAAAAEQQFQQLLDNRNKQLDAIRNSRDLGLMNNSAAVAEMDAIDQRLIPGIQRAADEAIRLQQSLGGSGAEAAIAAIKAQSDALKNVDHSLYGTMQLSQDTARGIADAFTSATDAIAGVATGDKKWSDVFREVTQSILGSIKSIISKLLEAKISDAVTGLFTPKQAATPQGDVTGQLAGAAQSAVQGLSKVGETANKTSGGFMDLLKGFGSSIRDMFSGIGNFVSRLFGGGGSGGGSAGGIMDFFGKIIGMFFHQGGVVGSGGTAALVNPAWFANAQRYHNGGIPGIKANEVPAILQKGEEVIKRSDSRHILNGGGQAGGKQPINLRVVKNTDPNDIADAMRSSRGETVIINAIQRNSQAIKSILG